MEHVARPSDSAAARAPSPPPQATAQVAEQGVSSVQMDRVGLGRLIHTAARRAKFVARFIYWTISHGSTKHAAWVANFEGYYW